MLGLEKIKNRIFGKVNSKFSKEGYNIQKRITSSINTRIDFPYLASMKKQALTIQMTDLTCEKQRVQAVLRKFLMWKSNSVHV